MRLVQVISDYIRRSILTTQGDLVVRGVAMPERLTAGAALTFLAGQGAGAIPAWEGHKLSNHGMEQGAITRSTAGNHVVTGLGFRPSLVIFISYGTLAGDKNFSMGYDYLTKRMSLNQYSDGAALSISDSESIVIYQNAGKYILGHITAFSNDGFTVTYIKVGAPTVYTRWLTIE